MHNLYTPAVIRGGDCTAYIHHASPGGGGCEAIGGGNAINIKIAPHIALSYTWGEISAVPPNFSNIQVNEQTENTNPAAIT